MTTPSRGRRDQVLHVLRDADSALSIAQIATELGVHPNTARFHLDTLVETGRAQRVEADHTGPGRPPLMFRLVRRMDPDGPRRYELLAEVLAVSLADSSDPTASAIEAGRAWAASLSRQAPGDRPAEALDEQGTTRRLIGLLDDLGFAPEPSPTGLGLRHCPFIELAEHHGDVICSIHLGLMQGFVAAWSAPFTVDRLEPFVEPDLCVAHLSSNLGPA